jgi:hypothetical protein
VSGIAAGEGLARLDDGSLTVGFFLLSKGGLEMESSNNGEKMFKAYLDLGRLIVAVFSDGVSNSALR